MISFHLLLNMILQLGKVKSLPAQSREVTFRKSEIVDTVLAEKDCCC